MINITTDFISEKKETPNGITISGIRKEVPITKVRCTKHKKAHYYGLVYEPEKNAPDNTEWPEGEVWVLFRKSDNKQHKLPVMEDRQIVEV